MMNRLEIIRQKFHELTTLKTTLSESLNSITELQARQQREHETKYDDVKSFADQVDSFKAKVVLDFEAAVNQLKLASDELNEMSGKHEAELVERRRAFAELRDQAENVQRQITAKSAALEITNKSIADKKNAMAASETEVKIYEAKLDDLKKRREHYKQLTAARENLAVAKKKNVDAQEELRKLLSELNIKCVVMQSNRIGAQSELDTVQEALSNFMIKQNCETQRYETKINSLKEVLAEKRKVRESQTAEINSKCSSLETQFNEKQRRNNEQLKSKELRISELKNMLVSIEQRKLELDNFEMQCRQTRDAIESLVQQEATVIAKIKVLEAEKESRAADRKLAAERQKLQQTSARTQESNNEENELIEQSQTQSRRSEPKRVTFKSTPTLMAPADPLASVISSPSDPFSDRKQLKQYSSNRQPSKRKYDKASVSSMSFSPSSQNSQNNEASPNKGSFNSVSSRKRQYSTNSRLIASQPLPSKSLNRLASSNEKKSEYDDDTWGIFD